MNIIRHATVSRKSARRGDSPLLIVSLGMLCVLLAGCGKRVTDANLAEVKADMSMKEVESILGQPTRSKSHELTLLTQMKTLPATRYYYEQDGQTVELIFVSDKLIGKNGHFEPDNKDTRLAEKENAGQFVPPFEQKMIHPPDKESEQQ